MIAITMIAITATAIHRNQRLRSSPTSLPSFDVEKIATGDRDTRRMRRRTVQILSRLHAVTYRATGGRLGPRLAGVDILLLTTEGNRTGRSRTVPLLYLCDDADLIVVASYGGRPDHPDWYRNLVASPNATVQVDGMRLDVTASTLAEDERARWWDEAVAAWPDYEAYQRRTTRTIPLVRLTVAGTA